MEMLKVGCILKSTTPFDQRRHFNPVVKGGEHALSRDLPKVLCDALISQFRFEAT